MLYKFQNLSSRPRFEWPQKDSPRYESSTERMPCHIIKADSFTFEPNLRFERVGDQILVLMPDRTITRAQRRANEERARSVAVKLRAAHGFMVVVGTYNRTFFSTYDPKELLFDYFAHGLGSAIAEAVHDLEAYFEVIPLDEHAEVLDMIAQATRVCGRVSPMPENRPFRRAVAELLQSQRFIDGKSAIPASWVRGAFESLMERTVARAPRRASAAPAFLAPIIPFASGLS